MKHCETCGQRIKRPFDVDEARKLAADGCHSRQIAEKLGASYQVITKWVRKNNIKLTRKPRENTSTYNLPNPNTQAMCDLYEEGQTLQQIGDQFGLTHERVRQILRKEGVASKGMRHEHRQKQKPLTPDQIEAAAMNARGVFMCEILASYPSLRPNQIVLAATRLNGEFRKNGYPSGKFDSAAISADYANEMAIKDICAKHGMNNSEQIYWHLKRTGTPTRRRHA